MKIILVSGGFDPIHSGHISLFNHAKTYGDKLVVLLNSDNWLIKKKGKFFMPYKERENIISNLKMVDAVINFEDDDEGTCINGINKVKEIYKNNKIIFCNGGDRNKKNIPEMIDNDIEFKFGVGGNKKINSSSWILQSNGFQSEERNWGKFYNLFKDSGLKLKELIVNPGKGMSYQRHFYRSEVWFISKGECVVKYSKDDINKDNDIHLKKYDSISIEKKAWHQIINPFDTPCHIIEIQYGEKTDESDIERESRYGE